VHDNLDLGTRAIHRSLAALALRDELKGTAIAAFHISRLLADPNRLIPEQVPMAPYAGSPELYGDYLVRHRETLLRDFLDPWIKAVNDLLDSAPEGVVSYHHHTMDIYPLSPRRYDKGGNRKRPPFQLFWERPPGDVALAADTGLAPAEVLAGIRSSIASYFAQAVGEEASRGRIDFPLLVPPMPFHGCRNERLDREYVHIIYEVRKDLLDTRESIDRWVEFRPWEVKGNPRTG
jgi:hypothetical protein